MLAQTAANAGTSGHVVWWIAIAVAIIVVIALVAFLSRRQRTDRLRRRFGPEYDRYVKTIGSQTEAESNLVARERRYRKLDIRPITPGARERYLEEWRALQSKFVDEPQAAIRQADVIIQNVMRDRGFPTGDFDRQTEDLSVEHADIVENYRSAHAISERTAAGAASTEEMRQAVIAYRSLF